MKHDHIHELMGVIIFKDYSFGMVSEWMENGTARSYVINNDLSVTELFFMVSEFYLFIYDIFLR